MNLVLQSTFLHTSKGYLPLHKISRHRADGFPSHPKDGVLQTEPANRGYTLTITQSRTTSIILFMDRKVLYPSRHKYVLLFVCFQCLVAIPISYIFHTTKLHSSISTKVSFTSKLVCRFH